MYSQFCVDFIVNDRFLVVNVSILEKVVVFTTKNDKKRRLILSTFDRNRFIIDGRFLRGYALSLLQ